MNSRKIESSDPLKRKEFMKDVFSKYWSRTRKEYGVLQYDKDLIHELILNEKEKKILEVGIGDGFPYSNKLDEMGHEVYGIDISSAHVELVKKSLPNINVEVMDAEDLKFSGNFFDIVFCFRSTWYFTDLIKVISEMIRVAKNNGLIMFDIQNMNHPLHKKLVKRSIWRRDNYFKYIAIKYIKNIFKLIIRPIKYIACDWSLDKFLIIETPTDPNDVINFLNSLKDVQFKLFGVNFDHSFTLEVYKKPMDLNQFDRLVYKVIKTTL